MSIKSKLLWLGIGGGLIAVFVKEGRRRAAARPPEAIPADAEIEAALDLASLDIDEEAGEIEVAEPEVFDAGESSREDIGQLYGVSTPRAEERDHLDNDMAMETGQNWLEALETDSVEDGSEPEKPLNITDDADVDHSSLDALSDDDIPVADRGAGGPAGL
jgi:hypothetical protein